MFVIALAVAAAGSLIPISGTGIGLSEVDVSCGPALGTVAGWTGPEAGGATETIMLGDDFRVTTSVWCQTEAGRWLLPFYGFAAAMGLLALACFIVALLPGRRRRSGVERIHAPVSP